MYDVGLDTLYGGKELVQLRFDGAHRFGILLARSDRATHKELS